MRHQSTVTANHTPVIVIHFISEIAFNRQQAFRFLKKPRNWLSAKKNFKRLEANAVDTVTLFLMPEQ